MRVSQRLQVEMSEVREKLNGLADDASKEEVDGLTGQYQSLESKFRAAIISEDAEDREAEQSGEHAENRELADVHTRANVGEMFIQVLDHTAVTGAIRELQEHYGLAMNQVPLSMIEHRAVTPGPANVGQNQQAVIPYVFAQSVAAFLGIPQPRVAVGEAVFPVLTTAPSVGTPVENATQAETTGSFTGDVLSPSRLQASFFYSREDRARFAGMDAALRMALSDGLSDGLDKQVVAGANGLLGANGLTNPVNPVAEADFAAYQGLVFDKDIIDGRYAQTANQVRLVLGAQTYAHAASIYRTNNSDESALSHLMRVTGGVQVSAHVPDPDVSDQALIVRKGMRMDMVAPIWEGVTIIPDEVTKAGEGQIILTAVMLTAVKVLRQDGFARKEVQLS